jgi:hypothetical protein
MFSNDIIISVKYVDNQTEPISYEFVYATDKNKQNEHATHKTKHALSKYTSFVAVDFALRYRLTEVMAEKQTENSNHGSFAMTASTG